MAGNMRYAIPCINLPIFFIVFPLNTAFLWIIFRSKSLWKLWAYRIIFLIGVVDSFLLITTLEAGFMSLLQIEFPYFFVSTATVITLVGPVLQGLLSIVLAYNRFVVILGLSRLNVSSIYYALILITWAITFTIIGFFCYLIDYYRYNIQFHGFHTLSPHNPPVLDAIFYLLIAIFILGSIIYVISIGSIMFQRRVVKRHDVGLLIQAIIPFVWLIIIRVFSKVADSITGEHPDVFTIFMNFFMRSLPVSHVVVYLSCNKTLRQNLRAIFSRKNSIAVVSLSPSSVTKTPSQRM
uniref:G protein-coupled receptor n=1 Tax=Steinernema glaseri TaxID=37863 RepID=A0A1I8AP51_9BILA